MTENEEKVAEDQDKEVDAAPEVQQEDLGNKARAPKRRPHLRRIIRL